jgi:hypothetical protein
MNERLTESSSAITVTDNSLKWQEIVSLLYSLSLSLQRLQHLLIWWNKLHIYNTNSIASAFYRHMYSILHRWYHIQLSEYVHVTEPTSERAIYILPAYLHKRATCTSTDRTPIYFWLTKVANYTDYYIAGKHLNATKLTTVFTSRTVNLKYCIDICSSERVPNGNSICRKVKCSLEAKSPSPNPSGYIRVFIGMM